MLNIVKSLGIENVNSHNINVEKSLAQSMGEYSSKKSLSFHAGFFRNSYLSDG